MKVAFFDIETDGLLATVSKMHCMCIKIAEYREGEVATPPPPPHCSTLLYTPENAEEGALKLMEILEEGAYICGHNIIDYDIPALEKLYPNFKVKRAQRPQVLDTLVMARLICGEIAERDFGLVRKGILPAGLVGSHKLKAWGYRLGELKGTYGEQENAWEKFSDEMLLYNEQDVTVTKLLYEYLTSINFSQQALTLEHEIQWLMSQQQRNGFYFDLVKAEELEKTLRRRSAELYPFLIREVPQIPDKIFVPKRDNKRLGYKAGMPIQRYKDFNPGSRQQVSWVLKSHFDYSPENDDLYEGENLRMDEETFKFIGSDPKASVELKAFANLMTEYLMVQKRLGQLCDGRNAWLKMIAPDGRIHGRVNPCGAVSGRATHSDPNLGQVPNVSHPYGKECRSLFMAPPGWYQVGADASGLELRCLAHFMYPYDNGAYANEILNGDIHTANQKAAGLPQRNDAKTFIYAFLYGAGDAKIGKIVHGDAKDGKRLKKEFLEKTPAIKELRQAVENVLVEERKYGKGGAEKIKWKRRYLKGLDGRPLHVRSVHSALNLLLQSAGALICKKWMVLWEQNLVNLGLDHGSDFQFMAWVHDEGQVACRTKEIAETVVRVAQESMREAQAFFNFRVQLDTEGKIGRNWCDCH